jgi:hypothetical protein
VVVGGDERIQQIAWPQEYDVVPVPKGRRNILKVQEMVSSGRVDHLIVMTRWIRHAEYDSLKVLKARTVLHHWPHGLGRLAKSGMKEMIKVDVTQIRSAEIPSADSPSQPQVIDVGAVAKRQWFSHYPPVSPVPGPLDGIGEAATPDKEVTVTKKEKAPTTGDVLAAFEMHPDRELRHRDLAEILELESLQNRTALHRTLKSLLDARKIRVVGGSKGKRNDPQRYMRGTIGPVGEPVQKVTRVVPERRAIFDSSTKPIPPDHDYLVSAPGCIYYFRSSEEALDFMSKNPNTRLFKAAKVRVRLEIEE